MFDHNLKWEYLAHYRILKSVYNTEQMNVAKIVVIGKVILKNFYVQSTNINIFKSKLGVVPQIRWRMENWIAYMHVTYITYLI